MKSKYAIFSNVKVTKIESSALFGGTPGIRNTDETTQSEFRELGNMHSTQRAASINLSSHFCDLAKLTNKCESKTKYYFYFTFFRSYMLNERHFFLASL